MSSPFSFSKSALFRPGLTDGFYPERSYSAPGVLKNAIGFFSLLTHPANISRRECEKIIAAIHHHGEPLKKLDDLALAVKAADMRSRLHHRGLTKELAIEAFALVRETAARTVGMRHFDSQLMGGWVMVHGGLAEMETGEGKTLTATLAAATAAMTGIPVHIITVNDYLVSRDAELMGPVYQALGLTVGAVTAEMDGPARRRGYACNITYCTNKQLAFDYLRDRILLGNDHGRMRLQLERIHHHNARTDRLFLNGLCFAIIDEADSVLIDEACTPLIISRPTDNSEEEQTYLQAMALAERLKEGDDFSLNRLERQVMITDTGRELLEEAQESFGGVWRSIRRGEELVSQALAALHLYLCNHQYLVLNGKVMIIDENTGRIMADRSWERGLHQMIEIKEECEITGQQEHMARMTYQRFFRRYLHLAGMTGTAREVRRELWSVYRLPVIRIPTNRPSRRNPLEIRIFSDKEAKWREVLCHIQRIHLSGRPVLVGTRSVADSELLSLLLEKENLPHQVLNARQDAKEAEIVARAGEKGCITVATNMAGRGTDIPLGRGVAEIGGLHIIATEMNEAGRIDRQLHGRCGRQGDPGSFETLLSIEDELLQTCLSDSKRRRLAHRVGRNNRISQRAGLRATRRAQAARERRYLRLRRDLLQMEERLGRLLAFSGRLE